MPWCPICKNEYREGISECADCKVPLVESLDNIVEDADALLFSTENAALAEKFITYLDYSDIHTHDVKHDEENDLIHVYVTQSDFDTAKKLFRGFAIAENSAQSCQNDEDISDDEPVLYESGSEDLSEDESDNDISADEDTDIVPDEDEFEEPNLRVSDSGGAFVKKADQYQDYRFSALSCMIVGIVGIVFCVLNISGMLSIVSALFSQIVMIAVFALFFIGGIALYIKSGSIKTQIDSETSTIDTINEWLKNNITSEYINDIKDENVSDEINYFNYVEAIKEKLFFEFSDIDIAMAESLIDEHLNNLF